jgi:hypothetical protein
MSQGYNHVSRQDNGALVRACHPKRKRTPLGNKNKVYRTAGVVAGGPTVKIQPPVDSSVGSIIVISFFESEFCSLNVHLLTLVLICRESKSLEPLIPSLLKRHEF